MRAGILTFHRAYNYGAVLQAYALQKKLSDMGLSNEIIDYWPQAFKYIYFLKKKFKLSHPPVKTWIWHALAKNIINKRAQNFEMFIQNKLTLSENTYTSYKKLEQADLKYDLYITGSDQVWNNSCAAFDKAFFLQIPQAKRKYSYAASFGFLSIPPELKDEYKKRLAGYERYSVREQSGKEILSDLLSVDACVNCDPTLLLSKDEWLKLIDNRTNIDEKYILVYYVEKTYKLKEMAVGLSKKTGYKIIILPCNMSFDSLTGRADAGFGATTISDASPEDFLALFYGAQYVLTNSFHGTVFSIIFQKQFISQTTLDNGNENRRSKELLKALNLSDREDVDLNCIDNPINWDGTEEHLKNFRAASEEYLKLIVSDVDSYKN